MLRLVHSASRASNRVTLSIGSHRASGEIYVGSTHRLCRRGALPRQAGRTKQNFGSDPPLCPARVRRLAALNRICLFKFCQLKPRLNNAGSDHTRDPKTTLLHLIRGRPYMPSKMHKPTDPIADFR